MDHGGSSFDDIFYYVDKDEVCELYFVIEALSYLQHI